MITQQSLPHRLSAPQLVEVSALYAAKDSYFSHDPDTESLVA